MSACDRWAAVDDTGPDAAYSMPCSLPRKDMHYALYVRHVNMLVHTVYILLEPGRAVCPLRGNEYDIAYAASGPVSFSAAHLPHADMASLPGARGTLVSGQWHAP